MKRAIRQIIDFIRILLLVSLFLGLTTYYLLVVEQHKYFLYGMLFVLGLILLLAFFLLKKVFIDNSPARMFTLAIILNAFITIGVSFIVLLLPLFGFDYTSIPNKIVAVIAIFFAARTLSKFKLALLP